MGSGRGRGRRRSGREDRVGEVGREVGAGG